MNAGVIVDNELVNDKRVLREIKIIRGTGNNVFVLCLGFPGKIYPAAQGYTVKRITIPRKIKDTLFFLLNTIPVYEWLWAYHIKRFIRKFDIDIIHAHDLYMSRAAFIGKSGSKKSIPLVLDLHENFSYAVTTYNWTKGKIRSLLVKPGEWAEKEHEYLGFADRIVVLSEEFRDHLVTKYPSLDASKFFSLPNVPDVEEMESFSVKDVKIPFQKKAPVLFYFGVVAERRGIFDALSVFASVIRDGTDLDFMIIGPVDKKDLNRFEEMISSAEISETCHGHLIAISFRKSKLISLIIVFQNN